MARENIYDFVITELFYRSSLTTQQVQNIITNYGYQNAAQVQALIDASISNGSIISITHSALYALVQSNTLIPGQLYMLTDFTTIWNQPDYDSLGEPLPDIVKTGEVERLVLTALTTNTFYGSVMSVDYPRDIITYVITPNGAATKGRITYREDRILRNKADFDFRVVKYIRYETSPGSDNYESYKQTGYGSSEFFALPPTSKDSSVFDCFNVACLGNLGRTSILRSINSTFMQVVSDSHITFSEKDIFKGSVDKLHYAGGQSNYIKSSISNITITNSFRENIITGNMENCAFEATFQNNNFLGSAINTKIHAGITNCSFNNVAHTTFKPGPGLLNGINATSATILPASYTKEVYIDNTLAVKLVYLNGSGVMTVANLTD